jgi:ParB family transcriptional regulator, chromosome partitioning protein
MSAKHKARAKPRTGLPAIALNQASNIPLDKLVLSADNVRTIFAADEIAAIADSIAQRSMLQSLSVRPVVENGIDTGMFEVPAGGRRLRALQLLAKQKRLAGDVLVPCIIKTDGMAEDDSLAENSDREDLHPLDEFRAFAALKAKGMGEEAIAAAYRVTPAVVRQRLRLASASPKLLEAYANDELTLDHLMAYCLTEDHARQEQVWESLQASSNQNPWAIRKLLTESTVAGSDRRALFVGVDTYTQAGGAVMRDLFKHDSGGYLQDPTLLMRLVDEKLTAIRDALLAKGWKWVEAAVEIPYQDKQGMRRLKPIGDALSKKDQKHLDRLAEQYDELANEHDEDTMPDDVRARLLSLETEMAELGSRPPKFATKDIAKAGVFVSIDDNGHASFDYGFVKAKPGKVANGAANHADHGDDDDTSDVDGEGDTQRDCGKLSDSLVQELTSYRTVGLQNALAQNFNVAFVAVLHAMCLGTFYHSRSDGCLQVSVNDSFPAMAPGLDAWGATKAIEARHKHWTAKLPRDQRHLWTALNAFDDTTRAELFAHCASKTVNAVRQKHAPRNEAVRHADQVAYAVGFDMVAAGWVTTVDTYLGRVTKQGILDAVREGKDEQSAQLLEHLKKPEMAKEAQRLLEGTGWLPLPLRLPDPAELVVEDEEGGKLPDFMNEGEEDGDSATA